MTTRKDYEYLTISKSENGEGEEGRGAESSLLIK